MHVEHPVVVFEFELPAAHGHGVDGQLHEVQGQPLQGPRDGDEAVGGDTAEGFQGGVDPEFEAGVADVRNPVRRVPGRRAVKAKGPPAGAATTMAADRATGDLF
ncbi:MAG: hypothetical protein NVS3B24_00010 [Candidatus Dormibacteria bacterium]